MRRIHKCNYEPALIVYRAENKRFCDVASYCPECGKIGPCLDNSLRIVEEYSDGTIKRRVKSNDEIYKEFKDRYPVFEIGDWDQENL